MQINTVLKWVATTILIVGAAVNSQKELFPIGPLLLSAGGFIWLIVAVRWREWSLVATNFVMSTVGLIGLYIEYFG